MKLVVVGGVAAGMSAAARARRLDETAEIVVLERGQHVSFANCGLPYHIGGAIAERNSLLLQTPDSLRAMLNLDVRVGHEVAGIDRGKKTLTVKDLTSGDVYEEAYEKLVLAPGATPFRPSLPGIDHDRVYVLRNVSDMDRIKADIDSGARVAVVIGGGYIGVEMAENLRECGLEVDLVEMVDQVMPPLDREMAAELANHMRWHGVRLHLGQRAAAFRDHDGGVAVELVAGETLKADLVVLSAGVKPDSVLAREAGLEVGERGGIKVDGHMCTSDPDIYAAGDAVEVTHTVTGDSTLIPLAGPANRQGRTAADNIMGRESTYASTQGTSIVKVFDMVAGGTGANEKLLKQARVPYLKLYTHPSGHAGYYPGTAPMHIKVLFSPEDGKLLGAQVVGYDGIDKRIDVLATALRAGLTVHDLQDLELSYAPPFGSAKDPVNMAGFVGANMLKGDTVCWYAEDYPEETAAGVILDVRSVTEYDVWHIPGSRNIPLSKLRACLGQLPKDKPLYVYCRVGFRSYLAYRLLKQNGFEQARTLAGGSMTFCSYHGAGVCSGTPEPPVVSYAEETAVKPSGSSPGRIVELDLRGLQCPGPIKRLAEAIQAVAVGDEIRAIATDDGFSGDVPAWCRRGGHTVVNTGREGAATVVTIRKGTAPAPVVSGGRAANAKKTMVVFSGDLDKVLASFIIANGAVAMGDEVTMFFTFWGLNALRKAGSQAKGKSFIDRMFGMMMPKGATKLTLSKMHMMGAGTSMMKHVMRSKNVESLSSLIASAREAGVKLVACTMSMDVMGIKQEELLDGIEYGGVAAFLGESDDAGMTLFI